MSSEIGEACQVVILCGKMIWQIKNLTVFMAVSSFQVMNMIYAAKWKGNTSYRRLLHIKGEENGLVFVNIGLEEHSVREKKLMDGIRKELTDHGILFAELPDLCGGDGNTQICVSARDAQKLSAMLLSHMNGKYRDIPMAEISEYDYTSTGVRADGSPTPEMEQIRQSAGEELAAAAVTEPAIETETALRKIQVRTEKITAVKTTRTLPGAKKEEEALRVKDTLRSTREGGEMYGNGGTIAQVKEGAEEAAMGRERDGPPGDGDISRPGVSALPDNAPIQKRGILPFPSGGEGTDLSDPYKNKPAEKAAVRPGYAEKPKVPLTYMPRKIAAQIIREHDITECLGEQASAWIDQEVVVSKKIRGKEYHLMSLPNGEKGIIVPDSAYRDKSMEYYSSYFSKKCGAFVSETRAYYTVDYKTGDITVLTGREVIREAKKPPMEVYAKKVEKLMLDAKQKAMLGEKITQAVQRNM